MARHLYPLEVLPNLNDRASSMRTPSLYQQSLFPQEVPAGLVFRPEIISRAEEEEVLDVIQRISFGPFCHARDGGEAPHFKFWLAPDIRIPSFQ
jgi:hypothetical protein